MFLSVLFFLLMVALIVGVWTTPRPDDKPVDIDKILGLDGRGGGGGWD